MIDEKAAAQGIEAIDVGRFLTARNRDNVALFEDLARVLKTTLPTMTSVRRYYWGWKLREISVRFPKDGFLISFTRRGVATIQRATFTDSFAFGNDVITMDVMLDELNRKVRETVAYDRTISDSLEGFVAGAKSPK